MPRLKRVLLLSVVTGLLGVVVTATLRDDLEDGIGLRWLHLIRGSVEPPREVVIVSMDESSRAFLNLPSMTRDWPRSLHARLIDRLVDLDASAIAMDIYFRKETDIAEDEALSAAIARAGNVVLFERTEPVNVSDGFKGLKTLQPIPLLRNAARAVAPGVIPDAPLITQGLSFVDDPETPTFPAVTLQVHSFGPISTGDRSESTWCIGAGGSRVPAAVGSRARNGCPGPRRARGSPTAWRN